MARLLDDWLTTYCDYAAVTETPKLVHFWCGVSALAGALRRKVWFDQVRFVWYPSMYVIIVAPPGVISKSTSADIAMDLLREVPGIKFGPDSVTWQSLVETFAASNEQFEQGGQYHTMSPLTLVSSEFGNLMDFQDQKMVNLFITLWDGRKRFEKQTKTSGNDMVEAPWINMLACTTPHWISDNMTANTIGGGFTSRCIFVYGDAKERLVPLLDEVVSSDDPLIRKALLNDLEHIATSLSGPFRLTPSARAWMHDWYENLWTKVYSPENEDFLNGYISRKQTHLCKLAMILSASKRDTLEIHDEDFTLASTLLSNTEENFQKVFSRIGLSDEAQQAEKIKALVRAKGRMQYFEVYRLVQSVFPDFKNFEGVLQGLVQGKYVALENSGGDVFVRWVG